MRSGWVAMGGLLLITFAAVAVMGVKAAPVRPSPADEMVTGDTTTTTTTMDPLDEFCHEACKAVEGKEEEEENGKEERQ
ncbi:hypothetical protein E2C01_043722 [Portunus trituberculatus]|uniref:Secreted protein n=1 Tax=Portunus trituberculatus TaxID=210409 RepID=A0A5B7FWV5_PORTR|nr:hypothetical protein [Portunus trituberculatus]